MQVLAKIYKILYNTFEGDFVRKKELFEQNTVLYNRLQTVTAELRKYKELYSQNISEINALRQALAEMELKTLKDDEPETTIELIDDSFLDDQPVSEALPELESATQYGAEVIGKIVLEGTKISNNFAEKQNDLSFELINLVLGKTEVCKSQIYDICSNNMVGDEKKTAIDAVYSECMEYFSGLTKQV